MIGRAYRKTPCCNSFTIIPRLEADSILWQICYCDAACQTYSFVQNVCNGVWTCDLGCMSAIFHRLRTLVLLR